MPAFDTVLVANRGEIAVRVIRTLRALGIRSVAVYSDADAGARHVADADLAYRLGPAPARESYLSIDRMVAACRATGARAVHPGYGFLSENAAFAGALAEAGITFIGPPPNAIATMGDKITAKKTVAAFGVPVVPGVAAPGLTDAELIDAAAGIDYPILVKPSAGGGGKGMRVVERPEDLGPALISARREAAASFGDDTLFLERFVLRPRHIEVQVLADSHGNVVHLGERECSLQRRHQKVIEEAPSPLLDAATRARIGAAACDTARSVDYAGAGTVEFIVSAERPGDFFFMEMNTRLQVEHPVTELVTGLDLVEWQIRVAAGQRLPFTQEDIQLTGHAVEARVYAEDPGREFLPTGGRVLALIEPAGPGVRVDSGLRTGTVVGSDYDPMLSKVIVHAATREQAVAGLDRALAQTGVLGVQTNIAFLRRLLADEDVRRGHLDTSLLDRIAADYRPAAAPAAAFLAAAAFRWLDRWQDADPAGRLASRRPRPVPVPPLLRRPAHGSHAHRLARGSHRHPRRRREPPPGMRASRRRDRADDRRPAPQLPGRRRGRQRVGAPRRRDLPDQAGAGRTTARRRRPGRRRRDHQPDAGVGGGRVRRGRRERAARCLGPRGRGDEDGTRAQGAHRRCRRGPGQGRRPGRRRSAAGPAPRAGRRNRNRRRTRMSLLGELPDEYSDLAKTVRDFAVNVVAPVAAHHDAHHTFPYEVVAGMADMGLFGLPFPEQYGGMGGDYFALCLALEELGKVDQSVAITLEAGVSLGAMPVYRFGTEQQKQEWLPRLASGSALGAFGLTEAGAGSDAGGTRTTAVADGDQWVINGSKQFITNSGTDITALITATAVTDRVDGRPKISSFLIPAGTDGLIVEPAYNKVGWNASDTHPLTFTDVRIPRENLLGEPGRGYANFLRILDEGRIAIAALAVGAAQGCVDESVRYAGQRQAFGRPIGSNQAIAFKIARMETRAHVARQAYYHAAALLLAGKPFKKEAAIAKLVGSEAAMDNARDATQIFGGYGFMNEFPVARHYRDSKILEIGEGTTEVQLMLIAREVGL